MGWVLGEASQVVGYLRHSDGVVAWAVDVEVRFIAVVDDDVGADLVAGVRRPVAAGAKAAVVINGWCGGAVVDGYDGGLLHV